MLWVESALVDGDSVDDVDDLRDAATVAPIASGARRLVVHVTLQESDEGERSYVGLTVLAVSAAQEHELRIDALHPVVDLTPSEQQAIQRHLVARHWPAWARAVPIVRMLLGDDELPLTLTEAARIWRMPLATLSTAAAQGRLPALRLADRQLVYASTVGEATARGLLHAGHTRR